MTFDIIFMVKSSNQELIEMTKTTIQSLRASRESINFYITVIESGNYFDYGVDQTVYYPNVGKFNYNHACNLGLRYTTNRYVLLCNNDLRFEYGFADHLLRAFRDGYKSVSPRCREHHSPINDKLKDINYWQGCEVGQQLVGWCIGLDRSILKTIKKFDEDVDFWYSDHVYAEQLKNHNISHALVCKSCVNHLQSKTLETFTADEYFDLTVGQLHRWKKYQGLI